MNTQIERKIISELSKQKLSFWQLMENLDSGELETLNALKMLEQKGQIKTGEKLSLNKKAKHIKISKKKLFSQFKKITGHFNPDNEEYYQERISINDIVKKIIYIDKMHDLKGANLVFLGDDDFCSVAAMLTGKPKSITVLEIDKMVLKEIKKISNNYKNLPQIKCINFDLSKPTPKKLKEKFDVFICEPPESLTGLESFVSKGISLLKGEGCAGYIGLTRIESSGRKWIAFQKKLINANAFVSDSIKQFEKYPLFSKNITDFEKTPLSKKIFFNAGKPNAQWWQSYLVRIELAGKPKLMKPTKGNFYRDNETLSVSSTIGK